MSRRVTSAPGKLFLWFMVIAVACLVEGALLKSSTWAEHAVAPVAAAPVVDATEAPATEPRGEVGLYRVLRLVTTAVRTIR